MEIRSIKTILKDMQVTPNNDRMNKIRKELENVTKLDEDRKQVQGIFKFLFFTQMNKQAKLLTTVLATAGSVVVVGLLTASTVDASAPGDFLYGLDKAYESVGSALRINPASKAEFELDILEERQDELVELEEEGADAEVLDEALAELEEQEEETKDRVREAEDNENSDEGALERIRERLELALEESVKAMEMVKEKYQNEGDEQGADEVEDMIEQSKKDTEELLEALDIPSQGEVEQESNSEDHDGEAEYQEQELNGEDNSEDSGNEDSGREE